MTPKLITGIVFKLLAIWLLVKAVFYLPSIWQSYLMMIQFTESKETSIIWPIVFFVTTVVASFIVAKAIWNVGTSAINNLPNQTSESSSVELEYTLFRILGVYFLVTSLSQMPTYVYQCLNTSNTQNCLRSIDYRRVELWLVMFPDIFKLALGMWLSIKTENFINLLRRFKNRD